METQDPDDILESNEEAIARARENFMEIKRIEEEEDAILKDDTSERGQPEAPPSSLTAAV